MKNSIIENINEQIGFSEEDIFVPMDEIPVNLTEEFLGSLAMPVSDNRKVTISDLYDSTNYVSTMPKVQPNFGSTPEQPESVKVLHECIGVQIKKSKDYQNPNSRVKQADYYPRGIDSIMDMINTKYLRCISLIESGAAPNHESLEDSLKDMINYASFAVSFLRGKIDGQNK